MTKRKPREVPALPVGAEEHVVALAELLDVGPEVVEESLRRLQKRLAGQRENAAKSGGGRKRRPDVSRVMQEIADERQAHLFIFEPYDEGGRPVPKGDPRRADFDAARAGARKAAVAKHVAPGAEEESGEKSRRAVGRLVAENFRLGRRLPLAGQNDPAPEPDDFDLDPHLDKLGPTDWPQE